MSYQVSVSFVIRIVQSSYFDVSLYNYYQLIVKLYVRAIVAPIKHFMAKVC